MKPSLVSCIVPVFNGERYLGEALDSILAQTYRPLEIIVADDGSTDNTVDVVASYGEQVRSVRQPNAGPASARNLGLREAQGECMAFLDGDDLWHPEKLARQMARLRERPEIDLCFTGLQIFWMPELADEERRYQRHPLSQPLSAYHISSLLIHRSAFEAFGHFNEDLPGGENTVWFLHAAEQGAFIEVLPDVLTYRRFHLGGVSRRSRTEYLDKEFFPILRAWRDYQRRRLGGAERQG